MHPSLPIKPFSVALVLSTESKQSTIGLVAIHWFWSQICGTWLHQQFNTSIAHHSSIIPQNLFIQVCKNMSAVYILCTCRLRWRWLKIKEVSEACFTGLRRLRNLQHWGAGGEGQVSKLVEWPVSLNSLQVYITKKCALKHMVGSRALHPLWTKQNKNFSSPHHLGPIGRWIEIFAQSFGAL